MQIQRFSENKNHIIDRLVNLTDTQKEEIKSFFAKHPSYENKIDWNDKSLSYKDFEPVLKLDGKSKTQARKKGIEGITEGKDYRYLGSGYNSEIGSYTLYQPLTYLGSKTLASNKVPPVKENGAQWCIAYQKTDSYWHSYTQKGIAFVFVLTEDTKYAVTVYPEHFDKYPEVYSFEDTNLRTPAWLMEGEDSVLGKANLAELRAASSGMARESLLAGLLAQRALVKNEDGSYSKETSSDLGLSRYGGLFAHDGRLTVRFRKWKGYFDVSEMGLTTLEGCPEEVDGCFDCSRNRLTSLECAPKKVTDGFFCDRNRLTSLEGAPETVDGEFNCSHNLLTSLEGAPKQVTEIFDCSHNSLTSLEGLPEGTRNIYTLHNKITSLEGLPEVIEGSFDCSFNQLKTLHGGPKRVGGGFSCSDNQLVDLEGGPDYVGTSYNCSNNGLVTLKGAPKSIAVSFNCKNNRLTSLEGAPETVKSDFVCGGNPLRSLDGSLKFADTLWYGEYSAYWRPRVHDGSAEATAKIILGMAAKEYDT